MLHRQRQMDSKSLLAGQSSQISKLQVQGKTWPQEINFLHRYTNPRRSFCALIVLTTFVVTMTNC